MISKYQSTIKAETLNMHTYYLAELSMALIRVCMEYKSSIKRDNHPCPSVWLFAMHIAAPIVLEPSARTIPVNWSVCSGFVEYLPRAPLP